MSRRTPILLSSFLSLSAVLLAAGPLLACDTPVHQYALERWAPAVYSVLVFHDGELTDEQQAVVDDLAKKAEAPPSIDLDGKLVPAKEQDPNDFYAYAPMPVAQVITVDVADPPNGFRKELVDLWKEKTADGSIMVIPHPLDYTGEHELWQGPLTRANADALLESPARLEIAKAILDGNAIVWVLLPCGDAELDKQVENRLHEQITKVRESILEAQAEWEASIVQPEGEEEAVEEETAETDAEDGLPEFAVVKIAHDDPREKIFITMLLRSEPDLEEMKDKPMVFPTFGRGRAVFALAGDGISEENIQETCYYLTGPCSCQIKDQNPGMDLLTYVDWDGSLMARAVDDPNEYGLGGGLVGLGSYAGEETASEDAMEETPEDVDENDAIEAPMSALPVNDAMPGVTGAGYPTVKPIYETSSTASMAAGVTASGWTGAVSPTTPAATTIAVRGKLFFALAAAFGAIVLIAIVCIIVATARSN